MKRDSRDDAGDDGFTRRDLFAAAAAIAAAPLFLPGAVAAQRPPGAEDAGTLGPEWLQPPASRQPILLRGGTIVSMDPKVGGKHSMSFTNFGSGKSHSFGGEYLELKPHERIRYTDKFDDANLPGEMQVTVTLKKVSCGTELSVVQEGVPEAIPPDACYLGWQESLAQLAKLVEPEIPD